MSSDPHRPATTPSNPQGDAAKPRGPDRRTKKGMSPTGAERRRGPGRRRSDFLKAAEEGELTQEQFLFVMAIYAFKDANQISYPSWTDVLEIVRLLGYRKTMPCQLTLPNVEDWREPPNTPAGVRTSRQVQREREHLEALAELDDFDERDLAA